MRNRSTNTQLLTVLSNIQSIFDNKGQVDTIYFDLSKAFDSVSHDLLLHKLTSFGIHGQLLKWIKCYLSNRKQRVTCDGGTSSWLPVTSGVPQGSILGPILFILYINYLPDVLSPETLCAIFADDTKIYRHIKTKTDTDRLQEDINKIAGWGKTWDLRFNGSKTVSLVITNKAVPIPNTYHMDNTPIRNEDVMNDLGILVSTNLKWHTHIDKMIKKANQRLLLIVRTLGYDAPMKAK